jgi:transcriptional regulator with XRE-family HTH domain
MNTSFDAEIRAQLAARRGDWAEVSKVSGVSHSWISKFVNNRIPNPGLRTLEKLAAVLPVAQVGREVSHG